MSKLTVLGGLAAGWAVKKSVDCFTDYHCAGKHRNIALGIGCSVLSWYMGSEIGGRVEKFLEDAGNCLKEIKDDISGMFEIEKEEKEEDKKDEVDVRDLTNEDKVKNVEGYPDDETAEAEEAYVNGGEEFTTVLAYVTSEEEGKKLLKLFQDYIVTDGSISVAKVRKLAYGESEEMASQHNKDYGWTNPFRMTLQLSPSGSYRIVAPEPSAIYTPWNARNYGLNGTFTEAKNLFDLMKEQEDHNGEA